MPRRAQRRKARSRLAQARIDKGVTQARLAEVTGLSIATIRRLDRGELNEPPVTYLINCARALEVALDDLLEDRWNWTVYDASAAAKPPPPEWYLESDADPEPQWRAVPTETEREQERAEHAEWRERWLRERSQET